VLNSYNLQLIKNGKCYIDTLYSHTPLYTPYIRGREEEMKEKVCLCGVNVTTCQIFVWVSKGVLPPMVVYVSLLIKNCMYLAKQAS